MKMKKTLILGIALIASQSLISCSTGEVAAGAIGVGVGIGIGSHYRHHHHHRHYRGWSVDMDVAAANTKATQFADKYNISVDAAKKIQKAFDGVEQNGLASFQSIGLTKSDVKAIAKHDLPSTEGIKNMAAKLDMSEAQTRDMLVSVNKDFEASAANGNSEYWRSCMQEGEWSTPQNASCTSANSNGCSPSTGATLCY